MKRLILALLCSASLAHGQSASQQLIPSYLASPPPIGLATPNAIAAGPLSIPALSGTQCLHAIAGVVSGTGGECGSATMIYPGAGVPSSTGTAWGTSYGVNGAGSNLLANAGTGAISIAAGKTPIINNSLTLTGADVLYTLPSTAATIARTDATQSFTGTQNFNSVLNIQGGGNANGLEVGGVIAMNATTPSCSPTCTKAFSAGSYAMELTLSAAVSTLTITPGYTAAHIFACDGSDITTTTERLKQTGGNNTSATITFYNDAGTATASGASDVILAKCAGL